MLYPKISVIVPVYNAAKHLNKCVDSILAQTYNHFELLLVDDGSKDDSGKICDEYAASDPRVYVFHKANGGVSSARNVGLDHATGEWISFCDSDDWVSEEYLQNLVKYIDDEVDLVFSYATIVFQDGSQRRECFSERRIPLEKIEIAFLENEFHGHTSPWSKLYRRRVIEESKLRFCQDVQIGEDAIFLYDFILYSRYIYITNHTDYFYNFEAENSLTKTVNSFSSEMFCYKKISESLNKLFKSRVISNPEAIRNIEWIDGYYVRRVLNSLYHNEVIKKKTRLETVKSLNLESYFALHMPALKERILAFLLKKKLFRLYDCVRMIVRVIR